MISRITLLLLLTFFAAGLQAQEVIEVNKIKASYRTIYTHTIIDAPPEDVWAVLMDSATMDKWSNTFLKFEGTFEDGAIIQVHFKKKEDKINVTPHKLIYVPGEYFGWNDSELMGSEDNHKFIVEAMEDGRTRFIQSDQMKGGMAWLMGGIVMKKLTEVFTTFNRELKEEVERRAAN